MTRTVIVELTLAEAKALGLCAAQMDDHLEDYYAGRLQMARAARCGMQTLSDAVARAKSHGASAEGRPRLTWRIVEAIRTSTEVHAAGSPEDLTGYNDAAGRKAHSAVCDALAWADRMLAWMNAQKGRGA